jgi:hypothetical protein
MTIYGIWLTKFYSFVNYGVGYDDAADEVFHEQCFFAHKFVYYERLNYSIKLRRIKKVQY